MTWMVSLPGPVCVWTGRMGLSKRLTLWEMTLAERVTMSGLTPVVRAQGVDLRARIPPLKRADVLGVRPGEGVDHLVVITHREQVVQGQGEQP